MKPEQQEDVLCAHSSDFDFASFTATWFSINVQVSWLDTDKVTHLHNGGIASVSLYTFCLYVIKGQCYLSKQ